MVKNYTVQDAHISCLEGITLNLIYIYIFLFTIHTSTLMLIDSLVLSTFQLWDGNEELMQFSLQTFCAELPKMKVSFNINKL